MTPRLKIGLAAAFAAIALLAVIGWTRKPSEPPAAVTALPANTYPVASYPDGSAPASEYPASQYPASTVAYMGDHARSAYASGYTYDGRYVPPSYITRYSVRTVRPRVVEYRSTVLERQPVRVVRRHHKRSTGKSVAIVAGS